MKYYFLNICKFVLCIAFIVLMSAVLSSCKSKTYVVEEKISNDSIYTSKSVADSTHIEKKTQSRDSVVTIIREVVTVKETGDTVKIYIKEKTDHYNTGSEIKEKTKYVTKTDTVYKERENDTTIEPLQQTDGTSGLRKFVYILNAMVAIVAVFSFISWYVDQKKRS